MEVVLYIAALVAAIGFLVLCISLAMTLVSLKNTLNNIAGTVAGIGESVNGLNTSISRISSSISTGVVKNEEKIAQVVQWSNVAMGIADEWRKRKPIDENDAHVYETEQPIKFGFLRRK